MTEIMEIWNDFNVKKPPFVTLPGKHSHSVLKLHRAIENYFSKYSKYEEEYNEAAALLSRLMARRRNSFNKMKGFKDICKLNAALCRLLRVDFKRDLDSFRNTLPDVDYEEGTIVQLPTRDSFYFVLIRLIATYELYKRIRDCCSSAADYFTNQIRLGFFLEISTLLVAVLAKINSISMQFLNIHVDLYSICLSCRHILPINTKCQFLKDSKFEFPEKLEMVKLDDTEKQTIAKNDQPIRILFQKEENKATVKAQKLKKTDMGQKVERVSKVPQKKFDIEKLNSVEDVKRFIITEDKSRIKNLKSCITSKILNHEWAGASKLFERKVQSGEGKKALSIFRKFLSLKIL